MPQGYYDRTRAKARGAWNKKAFVPTCHPEAKPGSNGLCARCYSRQWQRKNAHKRRVIYKRWELKGLYGLTETEYHALIAEGKCHLCEKPTHKLNTDHDHATGIVRGVLCTSCNTGLGHYQKIAAMPNLARYLETRVSQGRKGSHAR